MADRPIIMSGESVRAIMAGLKTQTRRVIKPQPLQGLGYMMGCEKRYVIQCGEDWPDDARDRVKIPYQPGDTLWVKETWAATKDRSVIIHRADSMFNDCLPEDLAWVWTSPISMPRWASRLSLLVTDVRAQRVQDISEEDAMAEGMESAWAYAAFSLRDRYEAAWNDINARRGFPFSSNPWVFAYTFEMQERSER